MKLKTLFAVALALAALGGFAFAWGGWKGMQNGWQKQPLAASLSAEHQQFEDAIASGNFEAAKALHDKYGFGGRLFAMLDEESFAKFSQMHNAIQNGDFEKAQQIRAELRSQYGLGFGKKGSMGRMGNCPYLAATSN